MVCRRHTILKQKFHLPANHLRRWIRRPSSVIHDLKFPFAECTLTQKLLERLLRKIVKPPALLRESKCIQQHAGGASARSNRKRRAIALGCERKRVHGP